MMKQNLLLYWGKKALVFLVSVMVLSVAVFYISRLAPGDPLMSYYGERTEKMSVEEKEAAREKLGLNDPIHVQYVRWLQNALKGDFGISYKYKQDVTEVIGSRIGNTLILGGIGFVLTFLGALGLGILCAWHEDKWPDQLLCKGGTLLSCIPEFWLSLVMILVFSVTLQWLPSSGAYDVGHKHDILNRAEHLILPLTVVVLEHLWYYAYMIRNKLLEETRADYVLLGKAKGLSKKRSCLGTAFAIACLLISALWRFRCPTFWEARILWKRCSAIRASEHCPSKAPNTTTIICLWCCACLQALW